MADVLVMFKDSPYVPMVATQEHIRRMQEKITGKVYWCADEQEALEKKVDAEILFFWGGSGKMPIEYCTGSRKLKWIHTFSAGINPIMDSPIRDLPVRLTNSKGIHGKAMALTTMGYVIGFLRNFPEVLRRQQRHEWNKGFSNPLREAVGSTLTIIGAGAIGQEIARMAKALEMNVIGVKRTVEKLENFDEVYGNAEMEKAIATADFVVVVTPLTDETFHMIGEKQLRAMKETAVLINIARGPIVDEQALIRALQEGTIAGAALDATEEEPLEKDSPLWDMENVIITPHCSADSELYMERAVELFCKNLERYESGQSLANEIDMSRKY